MTAPTHIVFGVVSSLLFGITGKIDLAFVTLGSLLPDIDHPKSSIGRIFYPISILISKVVAHRTLTHSIIIWLPLLLIGARWNRALFLVSLGSISHIILDCLNKSGVALLNPIRETIFVLAGRKYRINSGSRSELIIILFFIGIGFCFDWMNQLGGPRKVVQRIISSYEIAYQEYEKAGLRISYIKGKLRHKDGYTEEGEWLILGKLTSKGRIAIYDRGRDEVLYIPEDGDFLRALTRVTEKEWNSIRLKEYMKVDQGKGWYFQQGKWRKAQKDDVIAGYLIYEGQVELSGWEL